MPKLIAHKKAALGGWGWGGGLQRLIPAETSINVGLWGGGWGAGLAQTCRTCRIRKKAQDLQEWQADAGEGAGGRRYRPAADPSNDHQIGRGAAMLGFGAVWRRPLGCGA